MAKVKLDSTGSSYVSQKVWDKPLRLAMQVKVYHKEDVAKFKITASSQTLNMILQ